MRSFVLATLVGVFCAASVAADCIADPDLNAEFEAIAGGSIPLADSCCQKDVCGIPCAEPVGGEYASIKVLIPTRDIHSFIFTSSSFQRRVLATPLR